MPALVAGCGTQNKKAVKAHRVSVQASCLLAWASTCPFSKGHGRSAGLACPRGHAPTRAGTAPPVTNVLDRRKAGLAQDMQKGAIDLKSEERLLEWTE